MDDIKGLYVGDIPTLKHKTAMLRRGERGSWLAQFDQFDLWPWSHGWHEFSSKDFVNVIDYGNPNDPNAYKPCDPYRGSYASRI